MPQLSIESVESLKLEDLEKDLKSSKRKAKMMRRATFVQKVEKRNSYKKHDAGVFDASTVLQKTDQFIVSGASEGEQSEHFSSED